MSRAACSIACAAIIGCGGEEDIPPVTGCAAGQHPREDGSCAAPGLPSELACPPGEWLRDDGSCAATGVPADGCAEGFVHDGDRGCEPVLPAMACLPGYMAVPGDAECREVAPCAAGTWGNIPFDGTTEFVDASFTGGASDGSQSAPWTTIQDGIDAASAGAIVAVAQGSYFEDVRIEDKPVRLWGRCPSQSLLRGTGAAIAALEILGAVSGTEVRQLGITGEGDGVLIQSAGAILLGELWIRDNAFRGIGLQDGTNAAQLTIQGSLLERNAEYGILAVGGSVTIDGTAVRDTAVAGGISAGVSAAQYPGAGRTSLTLRRSLVERNGDLSLYVSGSDATVEGSVIRDTLPIDVVSSGSGVLAQVNPATGERARLALRASLIERATRYGVALFSSDGVVESTVVRDTAITTTGRFGYGIAATDEVYGGSTLEVSTSLIERNAAAGVLFTGATGKVHGTVVRATRPDADARSRGISVQFGALSASRSGVAVTSSLIEGTEEFGLFAIGSDVTAEATLIRDITAGPGPFGFGYGVQVQDSAYGVDDTNHATLALDACLIERTVGVGVGLVGEVSATVDASVIRDTVAERDGFLGDGVVAWSEGGLAVVSVTSSLVERSARATVSSFGGSVSLSNSNFVCQAFDFAAEVWNGQPALLENKGGVFCGCPQPSDDCRAQSFLLAPPPAVGGLEE